jgi:alpha-tubulin suppressor-like RCC1 family protein
MDRHRQGVDVTAVSAGGSHTALVGSNGALYTCGLNEHGQLGHSPGARYVPVAEPVEGLPAHDPVVGVSAGHYHTLCVTRAGELWAFGRNDQSQCGLGKDAPPVIHHPAWVQSLSPNGPGGAGKVVGVAAGPAHSLAVTSEGAVFSWGVSKEGVLGHGAEESWRWGFFFRDAVEPAPRLIRALADAGHRGVSVHVGLLHSACVDDAGFAHVWGQGRFNQLGLGAGVSTSYITEPVAVPALGRVSALSCGGLFNLAVPLNGGGSVVAWGANGNGELGGGAELDGRSNAPRDVKRAHPGGGGAGRFVKVSAGWKHSAGVTSAGQLYTWGWGGSAGTHYDDAFSSGGQLGLGNDFDFWEPALVPGMGAGGGGWGGRRRAVDVSCGLNHTVALVEEP